MNKSTLLAALLGLTATNLKPFGSRKRRIRPAKRPGSGFGQSTVNRLIRRRNFTTLSSMGFSLVHLPRK